MLTDAASSVAGVTPASRAQYPSFDRAAPGRPEPGVAAYMGSPRAAGWDRRRAMSGARARTTR